MRTRNVIIVEKDNKLYAFGSIKKASKIFRDIKPQSIYKMYPHEGSFKYKDYVIHRLSIY